VSDPEALPRPAPQTISERYVFLDGLRGWGAVVVLIYHYFVQVFPPSAQATDTLQRIIFLNGTMAVWVFFVVSGFSLSIGYIRRKDRRGLMRLAIGRYPRLAIPIFVACLVVHLMMVGGLVYPTVERPDILRPFLDFQSSWSHLFRFSLFDVFFDHHLYDSYIPPLWTMSVELIGSAVVISLLAMVGTFRWRLWIYAALMLALMTVDSLYSLFVAGIMLAELYTLDLAVAGWVRILLVASFLGGAMVPVFSAGISSPALFGIAAWCAAWIFLSPLRRLLELPVSGWLGRISFPLYLLHAPILYSFSLFVLRKMQALGVGETSAHLVVVAVSAPLAILAASLFVPVNELAIRCSRWLGQRAVSTPDPVSRRPRSNRVPAFSGSERTRGV